VITIDKALGIRVVRKKERFIADATKLPGTPPIGSGATSDEARFDLLAKLMWNIVLSPLESGYLGPISRIMSEAHDREARSRRG
jgi:hypothetical protein